MERKEGLRRRLDKLLGVVWSVTVWAGIAALGLASALLARLAMHGDLFVPASLLYGASGLAGAAAVLSTALTLHTARLKERLNGSEAQLRDLELEREGLVQWLHALQRRMDSLTVIRDIHAAGNIPGRRLRLRTVLEALAGATSAFRIGLYRFVGVRAEPAAYFEVLERARAFVYVEEGRDPWEEETLEVSRAKARDAGTAKEITATLEKDGVILGSVEVELHGRTRKEPAEYVLQCLKRMRPHTEGIGSLLKNPVASISPSTGKNVAHTIAQPLWAEGKLLGGLRVEIKPEALPASRLRNTASSLAEAALHAALALRKEEHREKALKDGLTGLFQKRVFVERLELLTGPARRKHDRCFALVMIDLDHFKKVNDKHGHQAGDAVLKGVAEILQKSLREEDEGFRYGGEELAVILKTVDREGALAFARRLRKTVEAAKFRPPGRKKPVHVTISVGVAVHSPGSPAQELIEQADEALYRSKRAGRNRVTAHPFGRRGKKAG